GRRPFAGAGTDQLRARPHQDTRPARPRGGGLRVLQGGQRRVRSPARRRISPPSPAIVSVLSHRPACPLVLLVGVNPRLASTLDAGIGHAAYIYEVGRVLPNTARR